MFRKTLIGTCLLVGLPAFPSIYLPVGAATGTDFADLLKSVEKLEKELQQLRSPQRVPAELEYVQKEIAGLNAKIAANHDYAQKEIAGLSAKITANHDYAQKEIKGLGGRVTAELDSVDKRIKAHQSSGQHHTHTGLEWAPRDHKHSK